MKADGPIGKPKSSVRVHSDDRGELCLQTSWLPKSSSPLSQGETLLKEVLSLIFEDQPYKDNDRPDWLEGLELDRHYPDLKLAFEYQGFQHSYFVPHYHHTIQEYKDQRKRDKKKKQACRQQKVVLVRVFYWQLSVGQVCQLTLKAMKKLRRWQHVGQITEIVQAQLSKVAGGKERKALNKRCAEYKALVKANYDSGKWVKHHKKYAVKHYPRGPVPTKKPANELDWSSNIARAEKQLREARAKL